jgi:hypothetical protein
MIEPEHNKILCVHPQAKFVRVPALAKHFNVQSNGSHEEVYIAQPLARHVWRQNFALRYGFHNSISEWIC